VPSTSETERAQVDHATTEKLRRLVTESTSTIFPRTPRAGKGLDSSWWPQHEAPVGGTRIESFRVSYPRVVATPVDIPHRT